MAISVDEMLRKIGEFREYQWFILVVVGYSWLSISGMPVMVVSFITAEPDWVCVKDYNNSLCNFTAPISLTSDHYKARCSMPRQAWTYVEGFTSTVTEYDLVCDKSILQSIAQSCYWVGVLLGLVFGGCLADRFGRRLAVYSGFGLVTVASWAMVFPREFMVFIVMRVFVGFGSGLSNAAAFVLLTEFTTEKYRALIGVSSFYFWVAALLILPLLGYLIPDWRYLLLATAVFALPCLFTWWFIPESIRWLLLRGKEGKARKLLAKVAKMNKKPLPDEELEKPKITAPSGSFKHLFYSWQVAKTTLISWDLWFVVSLVYYGVSYGSVDIGGNRYLNFFLTSLVELPSNIFTIWSVNRFGRKKPVVAGLFIAFIASAIAVSIPKDRSSSNNAGRIIVTLFAKFFINLSFSGVYVWSTELFPTYIRSIGLSTSSAVARLGSFSASYIIWLIRIHALLPYGIMGAICFQAGILALFLPETNGQPTLETMDDMVNQKSRGQTLSTYAGGSENKNESANLCENEV